MFLRYLVGFKHASPQESNSIMRIEKAPKNFGASLFSFEVNRVIPIVVIRPAHRCFNTTQNGNILRLRENDLFFRTGALLPSGKNHGTVCRTLQNVFAEDVVPLRADLKVA